MDKMTEDSIRNFYMQNFEPELYHRLISKEYTESEYFYLESLANIFKKAEIQGSTLLEIGCGPSIFNVAFAANRFSEIVLSDFIPCNLEKLQMWLNNDKKSLDWSDHFKICAKIQGYKDINAGILEIESHIRTSVKAVTRCDLLADKIVSNKFDIPYDIVLTCRALEAACVNYDAYKNCLKKINSLVKQNGYLIITGYIDSPYYVINNIEYPVLRLSLKYIHVALQEAGFSDINWQFSFKKQREDIKDLTDYEGEFCLYCVKSVDLTLK